MTTADAETGSKLGDQATFVSDLVERANAPDAKMTVWFARVGDREALDISIPYERLASRASDDRNGRGSGVSSADPSRLPPDVRRARALAMSTSATETRRERQRSSPCVGRQKSASTTQRSMRDGRMPR
jgi:hypothetical protein